jgi:hypothetical protein
VKGQATRRNRVYEDWPSSVVPTNNNGECGVRTRRRLQHRDTVGVKVPYRGQRDANVKQKDAKLLNEGLAGVAWNRRRKQTVHQAHY